MHEQDPRLGALKPQEFWNPHYNTPDGKAKVDARQMYYSCLPPGEHAPDYDLEMLIAATNAGIELNGTVVDVGCSFPRFLELWKFLGHQGRLVGVEPNHMQFNGLPYWKPLKASRNILELVDIRPIAAGNEIYVADWGDGTKNIDGIELYQSDAGNLPVEDESADLITMMWALYQLNEDEITAALKHISSKLKPSGKFGSALSGEQNKPHLIEFVNNFGSFLAERHGSAVTSPPPLQSGFTTEKAKQTFGQVFEYVAHKHFSQGLVVHDTLSLFFMFNTVLSMSDRFLDEQGQPLEYKFVYDSLLDYFSSELVPNINRGKYFYDQTNRDLFLCAKKPFEPPDGFELVPAA